YGLQISVNAISQTVALASASMTVWGFPGDKEHDAERFRPGHPGAPPSCPGSLTVSCTEATFPHSGETVRPLIDNPSVCSEAPLPASQPPPQTPAPAPRQAGLPPPPPRRAAKTRSPTRPCRRN